jgi:eukaryotic-like serine/threonine-protein kinase
MSSAPLIANSKLAGRYFVVSEVAAGGMTAVWLAEDEVLHRKVAIKVLHTHLAVDEEFARKFRQEALAAGSLIHPNVVAIYDSGIYEGRPFLVTEYLAGGTLKDRLAGGPIEVALAGEVGGEVCAALAYAHARGVVHRDLRPSNILFTSAGVVKVGDFGVAKAAFDHADAAATGIALGTVGYLSPEQVEGRELDGRSDLYSLGLVLYECVTGTLPFQKEGDLATAAARLHETPPRVRDLRPGVSRGLEAVIARALQRDPKQRFAEAEEMRRAIGGGEAGRPIEADVSAPQATSFLKTEGRWLLPTVLVVLIAVGLVFGLARLAGRSPLSPITDLLHQEGSRPITIVSAGTYDPGGDGEERTRDAAKAFDSHPSTAWRTESYATPNLGGLKDGVGITFDLGEPKAVKRVEVISAAPGWEGSIRHSDDGINWSPPSTPITTSQRQDFHPSAAPHRWWQIWITSLVITPGSEVPGNPYNTAISEVHFFD